MKILVDTHTHTVASGHAYSTLKENAQAVFEKGMQGFVCTDHGPQIVDGAQDYIINCLRYAPKEIEGVRLFTGTEANIIDYAGGIDIHNYYLKFTDFAIASLHEIVIKPKTKTEHTNTLLKVLENVYIDCIGHPGNPAFEIDIEAFTNKIKEQNKVCEINNHSFAFRKGSDVNCKKILQLCKEKDIRIAVCSDAHMCYNMGSFDYVLQALKEADFPRELVVNRDLQTFTKYIDERKQRVEK